LRGHVELTEERERHIAERHPDLTRLNEYSDCVAETVANPDVLRRGSENTLLFSRYFGTIQSGKHLVVAGVEEPSPAQRFWIVRVYLNQRARGFLTSPHPFGLSLRAKPSDTPLRRRRGGRG
jgi:hypothetical protein